MTEKVDQAVGLITISMAGITATLAPSDAAAWGSVLMDLAPLGLIAFLIWRVRQMDKQLRQCRNQHAKVAEQLLVAYTAIMDEKARGKMPSSKQFLSGEFDLGEFLDNTFDI